MNWKAAGKATVALILLAAWWATIIFAPGPVGAIIGLAAVILPAFWCAFYLLFKLRDEAKQHSARGNGNG